MVFSESVNIARRLSSKNENDLLQESIMGEYWYHQVVIDDVLFRSSLIDGVRYTKPTGYSWLLLCEKMRHVAAIVEYMDIKSLMKIIVDRDWQRFCCLV